MGFACLILKVGRNIIFESSFISPRKAALMVVSSNTIKDYQFDKPSIRLIVDNYGSQSKSCFYCEQYKKLLPYMKWYIHLINIF